MLHIEQGYIVPDEPEQVNHPSHYNQYHGFEVIDVCEQLVGPDGKSGFNLGNAFKYIARAGWKKPEKHVEDLEKSVFYIQREIDRIKNATGSLQGTEKLQEASVSQSRAVFRARLSSEDIAKINQTNAGSMYSNQACPECALILVKVPDAAIATYICEAGHGKLIFNRFYRTDPQVSERMMDDDT